MRLLPLKTHLEEPGATEETAKKTPASKRFIKLMSIFALNKRNIYDYNILPERKWLVLSAV